MMREKFIELYDLFKLDFYRKLYDKEGEMALTVSESYCLEVISSIDKATVKEVANFMKISQPNAAYKIANLEEKGYIIKEQSKEDRRKYYLKVTDKVKEYQEFKNSYINLVIDRIEENYSDEEKKMTMEGFNRIVKLMPELYAYKKIGD